MALLPRSTANSAIVGTVANGRGGRSSKQINGTLVVFLMCLLGVVTVLADITTGTSIGEGNLVSFSFDPIDIPGGRPPNWGDECGLFIIGSKSGAALWFQTLDAPNTRGFKLGLDFMLGRTAMVDGSAFSFAVSKAAGPPPPMTLGTPVNWRQYLQRYGNDYKLMFVVGENEHETVWSYPQFGSIQPLVVYRPVVTYDIVRKRVIWEVDGVKIGAMAMSPNHEQTVQHQVIGSSGSSTARDTTFLIDRVVWTEIQ